MQIYYIPYFFNQEIKVKINKFFVLMLNGKTVNKKVIDFIIELKKNKEELNL